MKKLWIAFICMFTIASTDLQATNPFENGDSAYIGVVEGLKLRLSPTTSSEVIMVLDFAEPVCIVEIQEKKTFKVGWTWGNWALVDYEGVSGYLYTGFLTPFSPPSPRIESSFFSLTELLSTFVQETYGPDWKRDTVKYHLGPDEHFHLKVATQFSEGVTLDHHIYWHEEKLVLRLPGLRVMDAYYLFKAFIQPYESEQKLLKDIVFLTGEDKRVREFYIPENKRIHVRQRADEVVEIIVRDPLQKV